MFYWIKIIHIVSASLLFGVGLAAAICFFYSHQQKNIAIILKTHHQVAWIDVLFLVTAGLVQPITGFTLIYLKNYALTPEWWVAVLLGYAGVGVFWLLAIYLRNKGMQLVEVAVAQNENLTAEYYRFYRWRCVLSFIAFALLIGIFYFMANVPALA